ncbi:rod shape-determining protein MreC [Pseudarcicella hirudinis]|uniref:Cell shape-determining protein MreC n=1 Tax=Pseudarcicella hirudinis TaxID=1079859 RepID=A0A1I5XLB2_9BACT|nr:rod shape-determining protein MreC [Pseudarcicella hirudinis]SFQ32735.1 rod shape-determining protein MreC [Pseudarcicella hirudinis]
MYQLFQFISRQRAFILFVLLEVLSLWCVYTYNDFQNAIFFNTSNYYVAETLKFSNAIKEYSNLRNVNAELAVENTKLHETIARLQAQQLIPSKINYKADSIVATRFQVTTAKVMDLTINQANNYLTIDKGSADGLAPGMGVISATGVVGKIKSCSQHISRVISVLHSEYTVSAKIKRNNEIGYVKWESSNPEILQMFDVSRYKVVKTGDTILTSDFNTVFPPNIAIGYVQKVGVKPDLTFHDISLRLATNFNNLSYVYVIKNKLESEQKQLEQNENPVKK